MNYYKDHRKWPYELNYDLILKDNVIPDFEHEYFEVTNGALVLKKGYAIDGVTAWFDFEHLMAGAFAHDALLQAINLELLPECYRSYSHEVFYRVNNTNNKWHQFSNSLAYHGLVLFHKPFHYLTKKINSL